jgi:hypothetical protein
MDAGFDAKAVAGTIVASALGTGLAASATLGKRYTAAASINLTCETTNAITAGPKFIIRALCFDMNDYVVPKDANGVPIVY